MALCLTEECGHMLWAPSPPLPCSPEIWTFHTEDCSHLSEGPASCCPALLNSCRALPPCALNCLLLVSYSLAIVSCPQCFSLSSAHFLCSFFLGRLYFCSIDSKGFFKKIFYKSIFYCPLSLDDTYFLVQSYSLNIIFYFVLADSQ